jgi:phosphoglycerate dehydrogenase-like enzyme
VLVTPHNAGASSGNEERVYELFLENLGRWQAGGALLNEVRP